jgi:D-alanyl-D-alanine carboxypeptidase
MGRHAQHVCARVGERHRHRALRATAWLSKRGAAYGLCQIYRNEPWHYELRTNAIDHGCPPMYADPTRDPRMQQ